MATHFRFPVKQAGAVLLIVLMLITLISAWVLFLFEQSIVQQKMHQAYLGAQHQRYTQENQLRVAEKALHRGPLLPAQHGIRYLTFVADNLDYADQRGLAFYALQVDNILTTQAIPQGEYQSFPPNTFKIAANTWGAVGPCENAATTCLALQVGTESQYHFSYPHTPPISPPITVQALDQQAQGYADSLVIGDQAGHIWSLTMTGEPQHWYLKHQMTLRGPVAAISAGYGPDGHQLHYMVLTQHSRQSRVYCLQSGRLVWAADVPPVKTLRVRQRWVELTLASDNTCPFMYLDRCNGQIVPAGWPDTDIGRRSWRKLD